MIIFPLVASTASLTASVTLYNPNASELTISLDYFDANNTLTPGAKPCVDVAVPAEGSVAFTLASQCTLGAGSHFGLLIASDVAATRDLFGYSRTENPQHAGFSIEGFPSENLATDTTNVTGLRGSTVVAPPPAFQTNCFVTSLADPITFDVKLFAGETVAQIGTTISGSLNAFEQVRYLDIFAAVNAPAATDFANVRAEFTRTSDGTQQMAASCTVQDNASFGADFRIAKAANPEAAPPPPPPIGNFMLSGTWAGTTSSLLAGLPLQFARSTSITLGSAATVSAFGGGFFAKQSSGIGSLKIGVCYQNQAGGSITPLAPLTTYTVNGTQTYHYANGSAPLAAGSYNVGLCVQNVGTNSINKNGNTTGFVLVGS